MSASRRSKSPSRRSAATRLMQPTDRRVPGRQRTDLLAQQQHTDAQIFDQLRTAARHLLPIRLDAAHLLDIIQEFANVAGQCLARQHLPDQASQESVAPEPRAAVRCSSGSSSSGSSRSNVKSVASNASVVCSQAFAASRAPARQPTRRHPDPVLRPATPTYVQPLARIPGHSSSRTSAGGSGIQIGRELREMFKTGHFDGLPCGKTRSETKQQCYCGTMSASIGRISITI